MRFRALLILSPSNLSMVNRVKYIRVQNGVSFLNLIIHHIHILV